MNKIDKFRRDAINKIFEIAGSDKTFEDAMQASPADEWYKWTKFTTVQYNQWKQWFCTEVVRRRITTKADAEHSFAWFDLNYGPSVDYDDEEARKLEG